MFDKLDKLPPDPILGVTAAFRSDPSPDKIDLGVGVYRDPSGITPVPQAVLRAEQQLIAEQTTKTYVGPAGNLAFNECIVALALGPIAATLRERTSTIQTVGGCGALRLGAELMHVARPDATIHVSDPTWANHEPLVGSSGLRLARYPYYDPRRRGVRFDEMLDELARLEAGEVVLLHACCHNPTGADLSLAQWEALTEVVERRGLLPFVDLAYQGFGDDIETDVAGLRHLAARVPELLLAISCSKNFGVYRERAGALAIVSRNATSAAAVATHEARLARRMYSMPPDHGAHIVARVLADPTLSAAWRDELAATVARMKAMRALLAARLAERRPGIDFEWLNAHRGMFSLLGLTPEQVNQLRERHHIYLTPDSRVNVAGLGEDVVDRVADAIAPLMG